MSERADARVVMGHLHYGVHEYIPQECEYITVLREPVARVASLYTYILGHPKHALHADLARSNTPLEDFLRIDPSVDNHQTRMVSGRGGGELTSRSAEPLGPEALEEAKRNLERFLVVGLTERFDESFILIRRALGWKLPYYLTANVTTRPKPATQDALEQIRERNQLDLELYDFANQRLSRSRRRAGPVVRARARRVQDPEQGAEAGLPAPLGSGPADPAVRAPALTPPPRRARRVVRPRPGAGPRA